MKISSSGFKHGKKIWKFNCTDRNCKTKVSPRDRTIFQNSKASIKEIILFIYQFSVSEHSCQWSNRELGWSSATFVEWSQILRSVCSCELLRTHDKIGGPGDIIEIDETVVSRRKYNRGRLVKTQWLFGGISRQTKRCFMVEVEDRSAATLLPIIFENVKPGSTILSDEWKAYNQLVNYGFKHGTVNHSLNFVNPQTGDHTQNIENCWGRMKRVLKKRNGINAEKRASHLEEFMWRQKIKGKNSFQEMISIIAKFFPGNADIDPFFL